MIDEELAAWQAEPGRKPLILRGARQTGKSTAVRKFGERFDPFIELNLERQRDLSLVRGCSDCEEFLSALALRHNLPTLPTGTLLFLDEIQESAQAVEWLRFLHEDHPEIAVIAAGSLLDVRLRGEGLAFPVGRVTFRTLRPLGFREFLLATERDRLADRLREDLLASRASPRAIHDEADAQLRDYLLVGGMPEAVAAWAETSSFAAVQGIHADLHQAFSEDFLKYRGLRDTRQLEAAFVNLGHHYGRRFKYENFAPGFRSATMKTAIDRLESAHIVQRVLPTSSLGRAMEPKPKSAPKLLPLDIGLALFELGVDRAALKAFSLERVLDGRIAEIYAGLQLSIHRRDRQEELFFWVRDKAGSSAEVDYLLPGPAGALPLEVKAGPTGSLKSLHQYLRRAGIGIGLRASSAGLRDERHRAELADGPLDYRLIGIPLVSLPGVWDLVERL